MGRTKQERIVNFETLGMPQQLTNKPPHFWKAQGFPGNLHPVHIDDNGRAGVDFKQDDHAATLTLLISPRSL